MKHSIRILACFLCLCLLTACFAACADEPGTPDATADSGNITEPDQSAEEPTGDVTSGEEKPDPTPTTEEELQLGGLTPGDGDGEHDNDRNWTGNY